MDEKRKRLGALGWTAIALAMPMLCVASFGPIAWALHRNGLEAHGLPAPAAAALWAYRKPLAWACGYCPDAVTDWINWYIELF